MVGENYYASVGETFDASLYTSTPPHFYFAWIGFKSKNNVARSDMRVIQSNLIFESRSMDYVFN